MSASLHCRLRPRRERGAALIVSVLLLAMIAVTALLAFARGSESEAERDRRTSEALAIAKAALIGFAGGVTLTGAERPGDLPCPDLDNDGSAELSCSTAAQRLGRLPWKSLGLPDLRDGDGERLWYALSTHFKNNPRTDCPWPIDVYDPAEPNRVCLNSGTLGTITVRDASGKIAHDATNTDPVTHNGIVAVVIAPGAVLKREDSPLTPQARDSGGINDPTNYLDVQPAGGEDNANFADLTTNGFISGPVVDGSGKTIINDRVLTIGLRDILPVMERRVAQEAGVCLKEYAAASAQKYPWAADMVQTAFNDYSDASARRYGRIPDPPFNKTTTDDATMGLTWVPPPVGKCTIGVGTWWTNWKSQVLYSIAEDFRPGSGAACGNCLTVNRPTGGAATSVRMVVMVAGRALVGQNRAAATGTVNANPANYVECGNLTAPLTPDPTFDIACTSNPPPLPPPWPFNDRLAYLPIP